MERSIKCLHVSRSARPVESTIRVSLKPAALEIVMWAELCGGCAEMLAAGSRVDVLQENGRVVSVFLAPEGGEQAFRRAQAEQHKAARALERKGQATERPRIVLISGIEVPRVQRGSDQTVKLAEYARMFSAGEINALTFRRLLNAFAAVNPDAGLLPPVKRRPTLEASLPARVG